MNSRFIRVFLICLILPLLGCSFATQTGDNVLIPDVPFFSQEAYQCGPTALAIVLDYWYKKAGKGSYVTPDEIAVEIYSPSARGVLGIDLELYARRKGFRVRQYSGSVADLRRNMDLGIPVIVFVDYGFLAYEAGHFMVVKGYSPTGVVVDSGRRENQTVSVREMEKIWKKNDYWALLLEPSF
jgi:predicted double-glycine peptidase